MADYTFKGYENFIIEDKINDILSTKLDVNKFMTADYSLTEVPGMIKKIHRYTGTGTTEDLARGEGNSNFVDAEYTEESYEVMRNQGQTKYYDDDLMTDPTLIDAKIQYLSEGMVNTWTAKAIAEFNKTSKESVIANSWNLADFADAINEYTKVYEDQAGLFFLANIELVPALRKTLGDYLKYTEAYIRTGAIGDVLGVPIYTSKAVPKGVMFLATNDAVKAFIKKDVFVEQDRDIDKKENFIVASRYAVIALVDETKCIKCGQAQGTQATITTGTKETAIIAGAGTTGATVKAYVQVGGTGDWTLAGSATATNSAYSITSSTITLATGDKIKVVASLEGKLDSRSDVFTVA